MFTSTTLGDVIPFFTGRVEDGEASFFFQVLAKIPELISAMLTSLFGGSSSDGSGNDD